MTAASPGHDPVARLVDFFEHLSVERVGQLGTVYSPHIWFKDPFNEVRGQADIKQIFSHM